MTVAVVYLSSKLGQVAGKGLFGVIRDHYPRWILYFALTGMSPAAPALDPLPAEARDVLKRALRSDPDERYALAKLVAGRADDAKLNDMDRFFARRTQLDTD